MTNRSFTKRPICKPSTLFFFFVIVKLDINIVRCNDNINNTTDNIEKLFACF
jgi:hypothetical protein